MTQLQTPADGPRPTLSPQYLHDLRTPLNQIIGYSEMLAEQAQEEGQIAFVPDLQKIHAAGQLLLSLINSDKPSHPLSEYSDALTDAIPADATSEMPITSASGAAIAASGTAKALILVVDDNEMNRDVLLQRLKRQGHDVAMAVNGVEAIAAVQARAFDMVLLDIMMPEMDGYEVLQRLKADESLRHIPVVMISALHEVESVVRCIEMGADDYLSKPFEPPLLKARIGACLEKKRAHDREVQLFEQLQQNYKRLQELEKLRDDLTNMIVHDLRTPLTSLIMGIQSIEMVGDLSDEQMEMLNIAQIGGDTLLSMINDLLDVEKMESGTMQLEPVTLTAAELVASAVGQVASLVEGKNLTLVQQITAYLPPFRGDESKLRRTLVNLLGNAIKFTNADGTIRVEARQSDDEKSVVFSVHDTGEGIPSEAFERIFEKFGQVETRQHGRKMSTGLGLAFCKLAVEAHGGSIGVRSTPGQGSTFFFTIPVNQ